LQQEVFMSVTIIVTDSKGNSTFLTAGHLPQGSGVKPTKAVHLTGWIASAQVFRALLRLTRSAEEKDIWISPRDTDSIQPFGIDRGECVYNTGSLFCYSGSRGGSGKGDVLLVLWGFPATLQARKRGDGRLNAGPSPGGLTAGDLMWDIVAVNTPVEDRVGNWDMALRAMAMPTGGSTLPF